MRKFRIEMFDSNCSIFSNRSDSQPQGTIRTVKDFVKKHASNIRQRMEKSKQSYSGKHCTMELKPIDTSNNDISIGGNYMFKKDVSKKSHKHRHTHRNKNSKDSSKNYSKRPKGSISTESILAGLQDVINFCDLLDAKEKSHALNETDAKLPVGKRSRRKSTLSYYDQNYHVMKSSSSVKDEAFDSFSSSNSEVKIEVHIKDEKSIHDEHDENRVTKNKKSETPSAEDISEADDKSRKYIECKDDPCGIDKCCGKSSENIPCVRIESDGEKELCFRYKCRSSLDTKCFPPMEFPPCGSTCKMCISDDNEKGNGDGDAPCDCGSGTPRHIPNVCNPEYIFPPGPPKRFTRNTRNKMSIPPVVQPVVGICTHGKCGGWCGKTLSVKYAVVKITEFETFSVYEVMKPSSRKPKVIPDCIQEIFVKKADGF